MKTAFKQRESILRTDRLQNLQSLGSSRENACIKIQTFANIFCESTVVKYVVRSCERSAET